MTCCSGWERYEAVIIKEGGSMHVSEDGAKNAYFSLREASFSVDRIYSPSVEARLIINFCPCCGARRDVQT